MEPVVRKAVFPTERFEITGNGFSLDGKWVADSSNERHSFRPEYQASEWVKNIIVLCSNASISAPFFPTGNPLEISLLVFVAKQKKISELKKEVQKEWKFVQELEFDSENYCRKKIFEKEVTEVICVVEANGSMHGEPQKYTDRRIFCFGKARHVLDQCINVLYPGGTTLLSETEKQKWLKETEELERQKLLAVGFAFKQTNDEKTDQNYLFLGLVGIEE